LCAPSSVFLRPIANQTGEVVTAATAQKMAALPNGMVMIYQLFSFEAVLLSFSRYQYF
jgi:hypothetical protein